MCFGIGIDDFNKIWIKGNSLADRWDSIGITLGISIRTINVIEDNYPKNTHRCLREVFTHWLQKDYDCKQFGNPSLLTLRDCIKSKGGGNDPALAEEIIEEFSTVPQTSPVSITSSTKGK